MQCDLIKPICTRCAEKGHVCGDFQEFFKFTLYDGSPKKKATSKIKDRSSAGRRFSGGPKDPKRTFTNAHRHSEPAKGRSSNELPQQISALTLQRLGVIASFSKIYALSSSDASHLRYSKFDGQPGRWLAAAMSLTQYSHLPLIETALMAISLTVLGRQNHEQVLMMQGRRAYGRVLSEFGAKLSSVLTGRGSDVTECLLLGMACMKTEYYGNHNLEGSMSHYCGMLQLLAVVGPRVTQQAEIYHALGELRIAGIGAGLVDRRPGLFSLKKWKYSSWMPEDVSKQDELQKILDWGFEIPTIMQRIDEAGLRLGSLDSVEGEELSNRIMTEIEALKSLNYNLARWMQSNRRAGASRQSRWKHHSSSTHYFRFNSHAAAVTWIHAYYLRLAICREIAAAGKILAAYSSCPGIDTISRDVRQAEREALGWADCISGCIEGFFESDKGLLGATSANVAVAMMAQTYREAAANFPTDRCFTNELSFCRLMQQQYDQAGFPATHIYVHTDTDGGVHSPGSLSWSYENSIENFVADNLPYNFF